MNALDEFVTLVCDMREAQREWFDFATHLDVPRSREQRADVLKRAKAAEQKVDAWLQKYTADRVQLEMWKRDVKGSELPGVYNVTREEDLAEHG
jgi:hypothetical protein